MTGTVIFVLGVIFGGVVSLMIYAFILMEHEDEERSKKWIGENGPKRH